jgi:hypothetical protein
VLFYYRPRPRRRPRFFIAVIERFLNRKTHSYRNRRADTLRCLTEDVEDEDEFEMSEMVRQQFLQIYSQFY